MYLRSSFFNIFLFLFFPYVQYLQLIMQTNNDDILSRYNKFN